jgi:hypothetical protein
MRLSRTLLILLLSPPLGRADAVTVVPAGQAVHDHVLMQN